MATRQDRETPTHTVCVSKLSMLAKVLREMDTLGMPRVELTPAALEVLARYHLGLIPPREGARLALIFERNPADAADRLERAADHLGITGAQAVELLDLATQRGPHPARDYRPSTSADSSAAQLAATQDAATQLHSAQPALRAEGEP